MREPFHRECFYVTGTHFLFKKTMPGPNFFDFKRKYNFNLELKPIHDFIKRKQAKEENIEDETREVRTNLKV